MTRGLRALAALLLATVTLPAFAAPKTDVVLLTDGSRIIGEVKSVGRGRLTLSTDPISTIYIEWDRVARLTSKQPLRLETRTGAIYFGSLVESKGTGYLRIKGDIETTDLLTLDVVRIETLAPGSRTCWSGDLSAGYSLVSANRQEQFNFNLNAQCRTENLLTKIMASDIKTSTSPTTMTTKPTTACSGRLSEADAVPALPLRVRRMMWWIPGMR